MTTSRKPAKRANAMRKAFEKRFDKLGLSESACFQAPSEPTVLRWLWQAFKAGAAWQRRRKGTK